ncbi:hypothetical protein TSAR_008100, partial [Trichomalopsis sarcophagae]
TKFLAASTDMLIASRYLCIKPAASYYKISAGPLRALKQHEETRPCFDYCKVIVPTVVASHTAKSAWLLPKHHPVGENRLRKLNK